MKREMESKKRWLSVVLGVLGLSGSILDQATAEENEKKMGTEVAQADQTTVDFLQTRKKAGAVTRANDRGGSPQQPDFRSVKEVFTANSELTTRGSTQAERNTARGRQEEAEGKIAELLAQKALSAAEAEILKLELNHLWEEIVKDPPTDSQVECYRRMFISPQERSFKRLSAQMKLVRKLVDNGSLHPEALGKILENLRKDLKVLNSDRGIKELNEQIQGEARNLSETLEKDLDKLILRAK